MHTIKGVAAYARLGELLCCRGRPSAALAGLIFVGVSINLTRILALPRLPNRAFQALMLLLTVLVVSSLLLVSGQSLPLVSSEVLVTGFIIRPVLRMALMGSLTWLLYSQAVFEKIGLSAFFLLKQIF
jgi:hypothetical protein